MKVRLPNTSPKGVVLILLLLIGTISLMAGVLGVPDRQHSLAPATDSIFTDYLSARPAYNLAGTTTTSPVMAPSVSTDKLDYHPGETVQITGSGFGANDVVTLRVTDVGPAPQFASASGNDPWTVSADASGNFSSSWDVGPEAGDRQLLLTADGSPSGAHAQTTFTDASIGTYDQCSNDDGDGYATGDTGCRWTNGNLQSNNSTIFEGDATVQRLWLTGLTPGSTHTITLKYGTTKQGKHAYDYLTTWNYSENWVLDADLCQDIDANGNGAGGSCTLWGADDLFPIPVDPNVAFTNGGPGGIPVPQPAGRNFTMRNGDITAASIPAVVSGDYTGDSETVITITYTVGNDADACSGGTCSVVLWFGAHVALTAEWASGGATTVPGSPYHVALDALDGESAGQRDNQMQAGAIQVTPQSEITIIKDAVPDDPQDFHFVTVESGGGTAIPDFDLDDDPGSATLPRQTTFSQLSNGTYVFTEDSVADWTNTNIVCSGLIDATPTYDIPNRKVTLVLSSLTATATCTFTNTKLTPALTVTKTPNVANICIGSNALVTYTYVVTNTGTAAQIVNLQDNLLGDIDGGTGVMLAPGASQTFTKSTNLNATTTNIVTASGVTAGGQTATATASATVTARPCTISLTKTPKVTNSCKGSNAAVTYTYVVTNTGNFFNVSGSISDNVLGAIGAFGPLAPGASATLTKSTNINGTTTNIGTATGTFTDASGTSATATATATVTGRACSISLTKTPSVTHVCIGASTQVTYTYVVTNTGNFFNASGTLTDNVLGAIGPFGPLAPGASQTLTKVSTINATTTNVGTANATFSDAGSTTATATATATVTAHVCTISVTKTPNLANVCNGATVTYTYTIHNNSDFFNWSGSFVDNVLGNIGAQPVALTPGQTVTRTLSGPISGTVVNTATGNGTFNNSTSAAAMASASATVNGHVCRIRVVKQTDPDNDPTLFAFSGDLSGSIADGGSLMADVLSPGNYSTLETLPTPPPTWDLFSITCDDNDSVGVVGTRTATYHVQLDETVTCTFTNKKRGHLELTKTVNGVPRPDLHISFRLYLNGDPGAVPPDVTVPPDVLKQTIDIFGDADGHIVFDEVAPGPYTACEHVVQAGYTDSWLVNGVLTPSYNPEANDPIPADTGIRCVDFTIGAGSTVDISVANTSPQGDARTIGYWKNWSSCTGGHQAASLDYVLDSFGGPFIDINNLPTYPLVEPYVGVDIGLFHVDTCAEAVAVLDKRFYDSGRTKKAASNPAVNMAAQLLAAKLNIQSGADPLCIGPIITEAQALLVTVNYNGASTGLITHPQAARLLELNGLLDAYNNNVLTCPIP